MKVMKAMHNASSMIIATAFVYFSGHILLYIVTHHGTPMKINSTQILPLLLIIIDVGAAAVYLFSLDYRKAIYWAAAAILSATVTF